MSETIPQIKRVAEIGDVPFQLVEVKEKILQGWNKKTKKQLYLFKTQTGNWGYYDKETSQVIDITEWKGKAVFMDGEWVVMSLYHKLHILFYQPVSYTEYSGQHRGQKVEATEALVNITDTAFKALDAQRAGRSEDSFYKFTYKKGKTSHFVTGALWVDPAELQ